MCFIHNIWCILFTIYDVLHSQYMMYFIHNMWCTSFTIYDVLYSQYMMYLIHNILCILFTIYDVIHSQYMVYFIHNILCTSFTIYYVFYSQYIMYFIHNIVNKIRHKCCRAFVAVLYIWNHSITYCNDLFSCSPAVSPHTKTNRQTWKPPRCSFSNFLFELSVSETADFLTRSSVACGLGNHFVHQSSWLSATR
jgi:hypothetical protein